MEFSPDEGYIAFSKGEGEDPLLVYNSPTILLAGNKTSSIPLEWDSDNNAIAVALPTSAPVPFVISFEVAGKIPEAKPKFAVPKKNKDKTKLAGALGAVQAGIAYDDQEDYSDEDEPSTKAPRGLRVSKKVIASGYDFGLFGQC